MSGEKSQNKYINNKWLIFTVIFTMVLLAASLIGVIVVKNSYGAAGIENIHTLQEFQQCDVILNCAMVEERTEREKKVYDHYEEKAGMYITQLEEAEAICVVKATGNLEFYRGSFYQEVAVKEVVKDASGELKLDDILKIFDYECLTTAEGKIIYQDSTNLLNPDNNYLVFVNASELNQVANRKNYSFLDNVFSCICLNREIEQNVCRSSDFWENWEINEFFLSAQLLEQHLRIEEKIISLMLDGTEGAPIE